MSAAIVDRCTSCGHVLAGGRVFEGFMANLFILVVQRSKDGYVNTKDFKDNPSNYCHVAQLRHWGLLDQIGEPREGLYKLTQLAYDFIDGKAFVPKRIVVNRGRLLRSSDEMVKLRMAFRDKWSTAEDLIRAWRNPQ